MLGGGVTYAQGLYVTYEKKFWFLCDVHTVCENALLYSLVTRGLFKHAASHLTVVFEEGGSNSLSPALYTAPSVFSVTGHFGHKILRHQDTLGHFGTGLKTLRHEKRGMRHLDTSAVIEEKPGHFDPGQFR